MAPSLWHAKRDRSTVRRAVIAFAIAIGILGTVTFLVLRHGGGSGVRLGVSLDCSDQRALPDASVPAGVAPTAERASANAALVAVLSQYEAASYAADYEICRQAGGQDAQERLHVVKNGVTRARVDTETTLDGSRFKISRIAIVDDAGARAAECSDNLGAYYAATLGALYDQIAQQYPEAKAQLDRSPFSLGAACVEEGVDESFSVLHEAGPHGIFPTQADDIRRSPDSYAFAPAIREATIAGKQATCVAYGLFVPAREEYCFDSSGRLLSAARSGKDSVERMQLVGSPTDVSEGDFTPRFAVRSNGHCNTETAWDRATPQQPEALVTPLPALAPGDYRVALSRHFRSAYTATYRVCSSETELFSTSTFTGQLIWHKGGLDRLRVDVRLDGRTGASYYALRGGDDATLCSHDLRGYVKSETGTELDGINGNCMRDQDRSSCSCTGYQHDFVYRVGAPDSLKIGIVDFEGGAGDSYARELPSSSRTYLDQTATCFVHKPGKEDCFSDDGVLLYSRHDDTVVEAVDLQPAPASTDLMPPG
jgi:hypothetical protein